MMLGRISSNYKTKSSRFSHTLIQCPLEGIFHAYQPILCSEGTVRSEGEPKAFVLDFQVVTVE